MLRLEDLTLVTAGESQLARGIAQYLTGVPLFENCLKRFDDGEARVTLPQSVRGKNVLIIQERRADLNPDIQVMDIFHLASAIYESKGSPDLLMPYYFYERQDKTQGRESYGAKMMAVLLEAVGINRLIVLDLHADQIQGFFRRRFESLPAIQLYADFVVEQHFDLSRAIIMSTDIGGAKKNTLLANLLGVKEVQFTYKIRKDQQIIMKISGGSIQDKDIFMYDDVVATGGTLCQVVQSLYDKGARTVNVFATHSILCGSARTQLVQKKPNYYVTTNSCSHQPLVGLDHYYCIDLSRFLAEAVRGIYTDTSIARLFLRHDQQK